MTDPRRPDEPGPPDNPGEDPREDSGDRGQAEGGERETDPAADASTAPGGQEDASEASASGAANGDEDREEGATRESSETPSSETPSSETQSSETGSSETGSSGTGFSATESSASESAEKESGETGSAGRPGDSADPAEEGRGPGHAADGDDAGGAMAAAAGEAGDGGTPPPEEPDRRPQWWVWAGAALVIIAIGGLAASLVQLSGRVQQLEGELARVPDRRAEALAPLARQDEVRAAVERLQGELGERIEALEQQGSEATRALTERIDELEDAFATVRELAGRNQVDWRMAEVHYLLAVSARRLAIAGDRRGAIAALEAADRSLSALGDVRLLELRASIIDDITAIRQVEPADVEGIALRLQALLERIPELSPARAGQRAEVEGETPADTAQDTVAGWWAALRERISRYIVVRRQPDGAGPARPQPDASLPGTSRLAFALSEARQAALRQDADAYRSAIERARRVVREAFAADSPTTRRFADSLERLAERAVVTTYPDLTTTLEQAERVAARLRTERAAGMRAGEEPEPKQAGDGEEGTDAGPAGAEAAGAEGSPESGGGEE